MSKTLNNVNHAHPHYRLKAAEDVAFQAYRRLSKQQLKMVCERSGISSALPRKAIMDEIILRVRTTFKQRWKDQVGWEFDDIYDEGKFAAHVKVDMEKLKQAEAAQSDKASFLA